MGSRKRSPSTSDPGFRMGSATSTSSSTTTTATAFSTRWSHVSTRGASAGSGVVEKGSITMDGVSLTVAARGDDWLEMMLIPHTLDLTTLGALAPGDEVNLEYDILAKYAVSYMEHYRPHPQER